MAEAPKALVLDWQTVAMQSVRKSRTSAGAERQAQSSVTSSQPEGSARPMGIRQLKIQDGADFTAGRAVIVYSGNVEADAAVLADIEMLLINMSIDLEVEDCAMVRLAKVRRSRSFMMVVAVIRKTQLTKTYMKLDNQMLKIVERNLN